MADLSSPALTREIMRRHGFTVRKKYGQNFLTDGNVLRGILRASEVTKEDFVLEIGPGIGTMTRALSEAAREVAAVEIDDRLIPVLQDTLSECGNVSVIHGDILKTDVAALVREKNAGNRIRVIANLPYYITTPVVMYLLEGGFPIQSITVMVQKEVAERMGASPGSKAYGALSLAVQYHTEMEVALEVPPSCFIPRPEVSSSVVHLKVRENPPVEVKDEDLLFRLIRASFNQRRKTLANSLKNAPNLNLTRDQVLAGLEAAGKKPTARGEELSLEEFAFLADFFAKAF